MSFIKLFPLLILRRLPKLNFRTILASPLFSQLGEKGTGTSLQPLIIFIIGVPGVGKGTHSEFIKAAFPGLTHLSFGGLIRYQDKIPGSWVSSFPRRETTDRPLLPARDAVKLVRDTIETGVKQYGQMVWLIDGFPRDEQHVAEWMAQMPRPDCALYLFCSPEVSCERLLGRAGTSGRPEDKDPKSIQERVQRNNAESGPMLDALEQSGVPIIRVDTDRDLNIVKEEVVDHIRGMMKRSKRV
ncbi:P-loop containing nucleoside triphosphate hydrolase protein [Hypoxylon trugodes]|uniref:P-loop containing nucleoside triphosphate hydrolase protein n=1 Tax=Hypoxylon trugodes TaxID=326681 RepID=UPI00219BB0ED|nr:P-loop containing nucleoside triphosphate hydrolase protein [Hypoxylon trugodes]KAI1392252.1 P-loop containing nucleoside triphosphate hydrolase protein [Hypoxylon trugodes]